MSSLKEFHVFVKNFSKELEERKRSVLTEATNDEWRKYYNDKYRNEKSKLAMSQSDIDESEKYISTIMQGSFNFEHLNQMLAKKSPQFYYIIDRMVEEYQKTGNDQPYTFLLSFYMINPVMLRSFDNKTYQIKDKEEKDDIIKEALTEKLEVAMQKYFPVATFNSYIHNNSPRAMSVIVGYVNDKVKAKHGDTVSIDQPIGGEEGGQSIKDKIADTPSTHDDGPSESSDMKTSFYKQLIQEPSMRRTAEAYKAYYIDGVGSWDRLIDNTSNWDTYGFKARGKAKLSNMILAPALIKNGFSEQEVIDALKVSKKDGKLANPSNDRLSEMKSSLGDPKLEMVFDYVVNDQEIGDLNKIPFGHIQKHTPVSKKSGIIGDMSTTLRGAIYNNLKSRISAIEAEHPGARKELTSSAKR